MAEKSLDLSITNIRGQEIVRFEIEAAIKKIKRKSFS